MPIAHAEGNYFAEDDVLDELERNNRILFRYCSPDGAADQLFNPNGSKNNIAGIINKNGNVLGMMPHPERSCNPVLAKTDGSLIFSALVNNILN